MKLHETLLKDEGTPDLDGHRDNLLNQISDKLAILTKIINERKLIVPKGKFEGGESSRNLSPVKNLKMRSRTETINRAEVNEKTGEIITKEYSNELDPETLKQLQKNQEAERAIREYEASKGKLNYHRISEEDLADVGSIDSSNIDYVEIFGERIDKVEEEVENVYRRVNNINEIISKTDKNLRDLNTKSLSEVQEYIYTLHHEMDELNERIKREKENANGISLNEETIKKLVKCK